MRFIWDAEKAAANEIKHDEVSFEDAKTAFKDIYALEIYDEGHSYDEHRYNLIGLSLRGLIFVVFTEPAARRYPHHLGPLSDAGGTGRKGAI